MRNHFIHKARRISQGLQTEVHDTITIDMLIRSNNLEAAHGVATS